MAPEYKRSTSLICQFGAATIWPLYTSVVIGGAKHLIELHSLPMPLMIFVVVFSIGFFIGFHPMGPPSSTVSLTLLISGGVGFADFISMVLGEFAGALVGVCALKELVAQGLLTYLTTKVYQPPAVASFLSTDEAMMYETAAAFIHAFAVVVVLGHFKKPVIGVPMILTMMGFFEKFTGPALDPTNTFAKCFLTGDFTNFEVLAKADLIAAVAAGVVALIIKSITGTKKDPKQKTT
ncbi:hypothetical protein CYMTET_17585 [Cymbomonas tetramitiformis]|uniref:Uncharacterized protein n=2 Tax=Cymbomonas tetramitiformis TaxID=36881 RepID=A0AAE0GB70_9CHLO|nr:hypothetical protein CYMTET_17585 [Cymbomonas tetramitiformis]